MNFKTAKVSYKVKASVPNPEDKVMVFEHTHEAIIDEATWERVQELLRLTRNTDLCTPVHFDFNHEHIVVEKKQDNADRFQIKCYF